jgi:CRISPR/Cas system-associated endonuclease Cas3-HD
MKTGYSYDPHTTASYCSFFLLKKGKQVQIFLDANLIRVAPECHDTGKLAHIYHGTFG